MCGAAVGMTSMLVRRRKGWLIDGIRPYNTSIRVREYYGLRTIRIADEDWQIEKLCATYGQIGRGWEGGLKVTCSVGMIKI